MSAEASWFLTFVELRAGRWSLAAEYAERTREIGLQYSPDDREVPQLLYAIALVAAHRGEVERARAYTAQGCDGAAEQGALLPVLVSLPGLLDFWAEMRHQPPSISRRPSGKPTQLRGGSRTRSWRADYVEALLELGRTRDAVTSLDTWEEAAVRVGRTWVLAQATRCRGLVAAARGDVDQHCRCSSGRPSNTTRLATHLAGHGHCSLSESSAALAKSVPPGEGIEAAIAGFEELGADGWVDKARAELGQIGGRTQSSGLTAAELRVRKLVAAGKTNREVVCALFLGASGPSAAISRTSTRSWECTGAPNSQAKSRRFDLSAEAAPALGSMSAELPRSACFSPAETPQCASRASNQPRLGSRGADRARNVGPLRPHHPCSRGRDLLLRLRCAVGPRRCAGGAARAARPASGRRSRPGRRGRAMRRPARVPPFERSRHEEPPQHAHRARAATSSPGWRRSLRGWPLRRPVRGSRSARGRARTPGLTSRSSCETARALAMSSSRNSSSLRAAKAAGTASWTGARDHPVR